MVVDAHEVRRVVRWTITTPGAVKRPVSPDMQRPPQAVPLPSAQPQIHTLLLPQPQRPGS